MDLLSAVYVLPWWFRLLELAAALCAIVIVIVVLVVLLRFNKPSDDKSGPPR